MTKSKSEFRSLTIEDVQPKNKDLLKEASFDYDEQEFKRKVSLCKFQIYEKFAKEDLFKKYFWVESSQEQLNAAKLFRDIFIDNDWSRIGELFDDDFGIHNGYELMEYIKVEFAEFKLKCESFELKKDALVCCYAISNDLIYFSLGKNTDKAVFEAIFYFNKETNKLKGNQYIFKIEPKIQFYMIKGEYSFNRRINLTPNFPSVKFNAVIPKKDGDKFEMNSFNLPAHLGGNYHNMSYVSTQNGERTYWEIFRFFTNYGVFIYPVLMRGKDHPLFIDNLYPEFSDYSLSYEKSILPSIINVTFENNEESYFKYPSVNPINFTEKLKKVCLTDSLSFDWIVS